MDKRYPDGQGELPGPAGSLRDPVVQRTVDGAPVKVGDRVWFWRGRQVRQRALTKVDLGVWWTTITNKIIFSTESTAVRRALEEERKTLKRARSNARRASASIARLTARLDALAKLPVPADQGA